jgi:trehalose synthase
MGAVTEVEVPPLAIEELRSVISEEAWDRLEGGLAQAQLLLAHRSLWNVSSTAAGGGVAEMLWSWVGLAQGLGISMKWLTISGSADFFTMTKRLHNFLHGEPGDGGELGAAERRVYEEVTAANATAVLDAVGPDDVVFLHDPQTAGLIPPLVDAGRTVVWRCHIGSDQQNELSAAGWEFLAPHIRRADACVFSRKAYVPECCEGMLVAVVPPSIDALSAKNQELAEAQVGAILRHVGLAPEDGQDGAEFRRRGGEVTPISRRCEVISDGPLPAPEVPLVVQVSRWDGLKDPIGVMEGFALAAPEGSKAQLILAGPSLGSVSDDPDGAMVLAEVELAWRRLPPAVRERVHLASLPMDDLEENAAIVNALQRRATIIVQKSLKEGFGLTVTEAMWKARPVLASATGGILDQIEDRVSGILLENPLDRAEFANELAELLRDREWAAEIGAAARERVRASFLEDRHTLQYVALLSQLLGAPQPG